MREFINQLPYLGLPPEKKTILMNFITPDSRKRIIVYVESFHDGFRIIMQFTNLSVITKKLNRIDGFLCKRQYLHEMQVHSEYLHPVR